MKNRESSSNHPSTGSAPRISRIDSGIPRPRSSKVPVRSTRVRFGTKSETLERLRPHLRSAAILPQLSFTSSRWKSHFSAILQRFQAQRWARKPVIVRSSAIEEDSASGSLAGRFLSIPDVRGGKAVRDAVERVLDSYGPANRANQVFIQPYLRDVRMSGVAFSRDPNTGGPYLVVNYDDHSGATDTVTRGHEAQLKTFYSYRPSGQRPNGMLGQVAQLVAELEGLLGTQWLDVEFSFTKDGRLFLLQVRPLARPASTPPHDAEHAEALAGIHRSLLERQKPHPYLHGSRAVFGIMPDWNPAEMIGVRPRPLALSLYKEVITDNIWAYQRDNYGYKNLRSFPLMLSLNGLPYIDLRVDFNSFLPKDLPANLSEKLLNFYMERLIETPSHHDKVEFEIVFSCYTLDLPERLKTLASHGFSDTECRAFAESLRKLTNGIINGDTGLWRKDLERIARLQEAHLRISESELGLVGKIYWLLEDMKRYGTLPFAGLARAAFIAVQLLQSLVAVGILSRIEYENFMGSLDTVGTRMQQDLISLARPEFLKKYGHLRPGTYDILSPRYDAAPDRYFDWAKPAEASNPRTPFRLTIDQLQSMERLLTEQKLDHDVLGLFSFIKSAIEGREFAKFTFTRSLSDALVLFQMLGSEHGFSAEDCAFADIECIRRLHASSAGTKAVLRESIERGRANNRLTQATVLPPVILNSDDVFAFHVPPSDPNFITLKSASGHVSFADAAKADLKSSIVFIPSADPGYDWIFSNGIAGLVTTYGGVNSHMAIRAGELGIPAIIGAGELLYTQWSAAERLEIDCANRTVRILA